MPPVVFQPMEADSSDYPESVIPLLAPFSFENWTGERLAPEGSAFLAGGEFFIQSRYALAEAMRRAGADSGRVILLPALHCRSMVDPALHLGAKVLFYRMTRDLCPDFASLSAMLEEEGEPPVAMLLTHYFGFPNAVDETAEFCAARKITLIEDCAHAFYGRHKGQALGTFGSYAAASVWKFMPTRDGAVLLDHSGKRQSGLARQPLLAELKSVAALMRIWGKRFFPRAVLPTIDIRSLTAQARRIAVKRTTNPEQKPGSPDFYPERIGTSGLRTSRWLMAVTAHGRVIQKRRENYLRWLEGVRSIPGAHPLFPDLPEGVVPYAFPLLTDTKGMAFHLLKSAGMPMWRWEDMAVTDCPVANGYRLRLLQLPCHQELRPDELEWMIRTVQSLLMESNT